MRTIKFRAFHKETKEIYPVNEINFQDEEVIIKNNDNIYIYLSFSEIELMQFTGLYDKNGKEVFEGDILQYCNKSKQIYNVKYGNYNRNADLKNTAPQYIGATFFLDGTGIGMYKEKSYKVVNPIYTYNDHAFLYPVSGDFPSTFERYKELWALEIIGNIHDNPELL